MPAQERKMKAEEDQGIYRVPGWISQQRWVMNNEVVAWLDGTTSVIVP